MEIINKIKIIKRFFTIIIINIFRTVVGAIMVCSLAELPFRILIGIPQEPIPLEVEISERSFFISSYCSLHLLSALRISFNRQTVNNRKNLKKVQVINSQKLNFYNIYTIFLNLINDYFESPSVTSDDLLDEDLELVDKVGEDKDDLDT
ncbi:hypothetical protein BpHYR1_033296 [Brachionus plicatilis]|uniref:Uncharacterized protein n=1 Tax=Brachionus plicatilis TaxID=10195 RepID=A0A3M7S6Y9_BRAPC|nr:hypothetical protein BpHYR1_033296 [Brachionus plicatilis]